MNLLPTPWPKGFAAALQPGNPSGHELLGVHFYNHGRFAEAERQFVEARNLAPDSYRAWYRLGALYLQTGRFRQAEEAWKRSIGIKPNGVAYNNLAALYFDQERFAEAAGRGFWQVMVLLGRAATTFSSEVKDGQGQTRRRFV